MSKDNSHHMCIDFASHIFTIFSCLIFKEFYAVNIHKQLFGLTNKIQEQEKLMAFRKQACIQDLCFINKNLLASIRW